MASYMDYAVKNAEQTGMLMGKAADAFMGVEDEEAAVERLIRDSDMSTEAGRAALLKAVGKISPDAFKELQTQMNTTAVANATTAQTKMNTENQLIAHTTKLKGNLYAKEFERDASSAGFEFAIRYYLSQNGVPFDVDKPPKTIIEAQKVIAKHTKKPSDLNKGLKAHVSQQQTMFINMRATQDAGIELGYTPKVAPTSNNFDTALATDAATTSTSGTPKDFNPSTSPKGPDFRAVQSGVEGTWKFQDENYIGGIDGKSVPAVWKFYPDTETNYTDEGTKFNIDGLTVTADGMTDLYDF